MVPAATGTDTAGSLRIPSALCGTSTIKPTRGLVSLRGVVPLATSLDHAGPMARTLEDCAPLLAAHGRARPRPPGSALAAGRPTALPRAAPGRQAARRRAPGALAPHGRQRLDADVADGLDAALAHCTRARRRSVAPPAPPSPLDVGDDFLDVLCAELLAYHRRFDGRRERYRPSLREWVEQRRGARRLGRAVRRGAGAPPRDDRGASRGGSPSTAISALLEPTVPCVAPLRGDGYDHAGSDYALISLTHYWDWTGSPVVALPAGVGARSGLPVGVSLIGARRADWHLLDIGIQLQAALGVPAAGPRRSPDESPVRDCRGRGRGEYPPQRREGSRR